MMIVPSLAPTSAAEAIRLLRGMGEASLVELRTDRLGRRAVSEVLSSAPRPRILVTYRSVREGGRYRGTNHEYLAAIGAALAEGADWIDVEFSRGLPVVRAALEMAGRRSVVLSFHDPHGTPPGLMSIFRRMALLRPSVVKCSVLARSTADTAAVCAILARARSLRQRTVAISMGPYGTHTRILQAVLGGHLTFSAADDRLATAPGQMAHNELAKVYRADRLDRATRVFCLVGNPVAQSAGKFFHNAVFRRRRANAVYVDVLVDDLRGFMSGISGYFSGFSVTMPFKREMIPWLDRSDDTVRLSGAVNTVLRVRGRLLGFNTDYGAFLSLLKRRTGLRGKRILILGTGGAAVTAAAAGIAEGARVIFCGRSPRRTREIARAFGSEWIGYDALADMPADILVHATPAGMAGRGGPLPGGRNIPRRVIGRYPLVCDFVKPSGTMTPLVRNALAASCGVVTGEEIFREQARIQSSHFLSLLR